ncbi:MAG: hypothetical protein NC337_03530 [Roseburia sp.]|nr:hypothetical protein [Roseburia sp.]
MDQRAFVRFIQTCRRRLNMAGFLKNAVFALCIGAGAGVVFQTAALLLPFWYANLYTGLALALALLAALATTLVKRISPEQAALAIDRFGFEERIVTAYELLGQEGEFPAMQREDAMRQLAAHRDRVRIPLCPSPKRLLALAGLLAALLCLAVLPAETKERARELHMVRESAEEKEEEIEALMDALEELAQEGLTPEQQEAVEEAMTSLEISLSEYQQAYSADMLAAATEKLDYKYGEMNERFKDLLQGLSEDSVVYTTLAQGASGNPGDSAQNGQGNENVSGDGQGSDRGDAQNGSGDGQGTGNGSDQGDGQGSGSGQGAGSGQGGGDSQNGQGDGSGQSGGAGSGDGRGDGSSNASHDYVSVPNAIADSGNLSGNAANHDTSEYFFAQNGLSWEGTHMSHEAVIGSYEQNAYEGIAAGRYPGGMEDIIKEYFASFNTK